MVNSLPFRFIYLDLDLPFKITQLLSNKAKYSESIEQK